MTALIRHARDSDLPELLTLYGQLGAGNVIHDAAAAAETWRRILASELVTVHVADIGGRALASCVLVIVPNMTRQLRPFALIENVVTLDRMRGQGLGKRVISAAIEQAWAAGCYKVMLQTGRDEAVQSFYESCGFVRGKTAFEIRRSPAAQSLA